MNGSQNLAPVRFGSALAVAAAVLYAVCALAVALWPDGTLDFFNAWFHGIDGGVLLAAFYNLFGRRRA
jgi:hypothetical protein